MSKDNDPGKCPLTKTTILHPKPGFVCPDAGCNSYLVVVLKGSRRGQLKWHHPMECVEEEGTCSMCAVYKVGGVPPVAA